MKFLAIFALLIVIVTAFPSDERQPDPPNHELEPEQSPSEPNTLLSAEANPKGDNDGSEAERPKRTLFLSLFHPYPVVYTSYYATPFVAAPVVVDPATAVVVKTKVVTSPVVSVDAPGVSVRV